MFKIYYQLAKPGIIYGNAIPAIAGFLLASKGHFHPTLFAAMLIGISLVIASGCVINNYLDRDIDARMERTKNRALASGAISGRAALVYASIAGVLGLLTLILFTNVLAAAVALGGWIFYVIFYTWSKRRTVYSTLIGSVAGATPPVVGYCAVTGRLDLGALILFLILAFWQMPHFYAIAIFRQSDYAAANIPVLPLVKGMRVTQINIFAYILGFTAASAALAIYGYTGRIYLFVALVLGIIWLWYSAKGFWATDITRWARKLFLVSLIVLTVLSLTISLHPI